MVDTQAQVPGKPYSIDYGSLPLTFTTLPHGPESLCTVRSDRGALPVNIEIPAPVTVIHLADSVTTATLDFYPADAPVTDVPECDFSGTLPALGAVVSRLTGAADVTNDCLLTSSGHVTSDVIARWSIPGFVEDVPDQYALPVCSTRPLTYFVDLDALNQAAGQPDSFAGQLQELETYLHLTLIRNLPIVDPIGIIQDPPAHLSITDPRCRIVGYSANGTVRTFPGAGYTEVGDRSIAWILAPVAGIYHVTASGPAGSPFTTDFAVLDALGRNAVPVIENALWQGRLGRDGTDSRTFSVPAYQLSTSPPR